MLNPARALRALGLALTGQGAVQFLGMLVGLAIVRGLSVEEYALYTIAMLGVSLATVLADSGVSSAALSLASPRWQEPAWISTVAATARRWRLRLLAVTSLFATALVFVLCLRLGTSWSAALVLCGGMLPLIVFSMLSQLEEMPLRVIRWIGTLQHIQLVGTLARAGFTALILLVTPTAAVVLFVAALAQWLVLGRLTRAGHRAGLIQASAQPELEPHFRHAFRNAFPTTVFYCLSGQITYLLVSLFAGATEVAGLGALGRFSMVFAVINSSLALVITPWFARRPAGGGSLRRAYAVALGAFALMVSMVTVGLVIVREPLLWLLGPSYTGLQQEFILLMVSSATGVVSGAAYHLGAARNSYVSPGFYVVTAIVVQALAIVLLDMSRLLDVILVGLLVNTWSLAVYAGGFLLFPSRGKVLPPGPG